MTRGFLAATALAIAAPLFAQPAGGAARLAEFKAFAEKYRTERSVLSFSYAIVKDGRIVAAEGFGWQDHDAEERTTADTSYLVASITKTFTGATLLAMDADGVIDLDDAFTTLSDWKERCEWLATSGSIFGGGKALDDGYVPPKIDCTARITVRQVLQMRALGTPGSNFMYNPIIYGRLANWVEEKTSRPFDSWVRRYVIDKAGLEDMAAGWRDAKGAMALVNLAPPFRYVKDGEGRFMPSPLPNPEMNASSGIIASARRLADTRWRSTRDTSCRGRCSRPCGPRRSIPTAGRRATPTAGGRNPGRGSDSCGTPATGPMPTPGCCSRCPAGG